LSTEATAPAFQVTGITPDGAEVALLRDGTWQI
jgi:hypothetical protein